MIEINEFLIMEKERRIRLVLNQAENSNFKFLDILLSDDISNMVITFQFNLIGIPSYIEWDMIQIMGAKFYIHNSNLNLIKIHNTGPDVISLYNALMLIKNRILIPKFKNSNDVIEFMMNKITRFDYHKQRIKEIIEMETNE